MHWNDTRVITIAEAMAGQSIPPDTVIVGTPAQQYKIIGNAVDMSLAHSLGIKLREAWVRSHAKFAGTDLLAPIRAVDSVPQSTLTAPISTPLNEDEFDSLPAKSPLKNLLRHTRKLELCTTPTTLMIQT